MPVDFAKPFWVPAILVAVQLYQGGALWGLHAHADWMFYVAFHTRSWFKRTIFLKQKSIYSNITSKSFCSVAYPLSIRNFTNQLL